MAGKVYKSTKIQSLGALLTAMHADFKAAGFTSILPAGETPLVLTGGLGKIVLESSPTNNTLHATQPYRIFVEVFTIDGGQSMRISVANPQQISNTGAVSSFPYLPYSTNQGQAPYQGEWVMGRIGAKFQPLPYRENGSGISSPQSDGLAIGDVFIARNGRHNYHVDSGTTLSTLLAVSDHGFTFHVQEDSADVPARFSFLAVQVPVDKTSGEPMTDLFTPIFCVYNCDNSGYKKFVVSESDVFRPTNPVDASKDTVNSAAILNANVQVSLRRGNKYMITLPNRINTDRYAYDEELDMFAYASADVIGENSLVPVRFYGETSDRIYQGVKSSDRSSGMRLLVLVEGGGIPEVV